mgnify:CR=1 FL=1
MKFLRFFGEAHHEKLDSIQVANEKRKKYLTFEDDEQASEKERERESEKIIKELIFVVVLCIFQCATVIE